ncbi:hypothetical protein B566_EDAN015178 [Ephemera danica]|nr:hypothetical protein B566_EDAN015178 [Ephemera danica]
MRRKFKKKVLNMADVAETDRQKIKKSLLEWDNSEKPLAPLTALQRDTVLELLQQTSQRPVSSEFLKWYAQVECELAREKDGPYLSYKSQLIERRNECVKLLEQIESSIHELMLLNNQFLLVANKTTALHNMSEQLMADQRRLATIASSVEERLKPFSELDRLVVQLDSPTLSVASENFALLLKKLDEVTDYVERHPNYKESRTYASRCSSLLARVIALMRSFVVQALQNATQQVLPLLAGVAVNNPSSGVVAIPATDSQSAFALFYGKFQASAPRIKAVVTLIEARQDRAEYRSLLEQCHQSYVNQREQLLSPSVRSTVAELSRAHKGDHCALVRAGCAFLVHVSQDEHQLFSQFFNQTSAPAFTTYLEGLCSNLYDQLRPFIIHVNHLETLAELCSILRLEMLEEHVHNSPESLAAFGRLAWQLLQDVQERLVFRAHLYLKSDVEQYRPAAGDLAYPEKLEMMESIAQSLQQQQAGDSTEQPLQPCSRTGSSPADLHGMWYPTVRRTLACLSRLYRCVDRAIFQGLSQEALSACSSIDAELFQVKHLLILREQIAPFQVDFTIKETSLDFSQVKSAAAGLLSSRGRMFSLGSTNSILELLVAGTMPHIKEHLRDSRKEVDLQLKHSCEALIEHATKKLAQSLMAFLDQVQHFHAAGGSSELLSKQPWAAADAVAEVVNDTQKRIKSQLPAFQRSMQLYLANRETEFILFRPIKNNVVGCFVQLQQTLSSGGYTADELLVIGCPTPEQVSVLLSATLASTEHSTSSS